MHDLSPLKNMSTNNNTHFVNQKLEHCDDFSFRERFLRIRIFFVKIRFDLPWLLFFFNETKMNLFF